MLNVLEMLEKSSKKYGKKIAFADPEDEISYEKLYVTSRKIAIYFLRNHIMQGDSYDNSIVFLTEKSVKSVCAMFGAVYCNAFYSYVDLRQSANRISVILKTINPSLIITHEKVSETLSECIQEFTHMTLEEMFEGIKNISYTPDYESDEDTKILSDIRKRFYDMLPLYVNFTSGSTGVPKGVVVSHSSVVKFIKAFVDTTGISSSDVIANQSPFDFDVSVKDIYGGMHKGATIQLIPRKYFTNPCVLMDYLCDRKVTTLIWAVTAICFVSIMNGLEYRKPEYINKIMFSGEVMPIKHLNKWRKFFPEATYINLYGPTEVTCNCTYHILDREYRDEETIPIGKPFKNYRVFLLDENNQLVTDNGVKGEICVSGSNLALGYLNDPEKTDEAFVYNPLISNRREIMYRTGDIGKYDNKSLYYCSRKDNQIKHMGHRIELGDIEAATVANQGVELAACIYDKEHEKLILFYSGDISRQDLNKELRNRLPQYMIPGKTIQLEKMPINKNGKIDRKQLKISVNVSD